MHPAITLCEPITKKFEGLRLRPYLCPAGVPTIGYGSTRYEDGRRVTLADPKITVERAEQLLQHELATTLPRVLAACPMLLLWGDNAIAAILDFTFNLGIGNLQASTLRKKIAADDHEGAKRELMKWVMGGGKALPGLIKRRAMECQLLEWT